MGPRYLLAIALATAAAVAACGDGSTDTLSNGNRGSAASTTKGPKSTGTGTDTGEKTGADDAVSGDATPTGPVATNSPGGKAFYKSTVHPFMATACGACHGAAGPGPEWLTAADSEKSYTQLFKVGYVIRQSRIIVKGTHGGVTTNVLDATQKATYNSWVEMEIKDGGGAAPPNLLAKLGTCFDRQKFDAMQMGQWRTTRRNNDPNNGNNTNQITPWNENPDTCTGCDNAPCTTCHSADAATNFNNAVGNTLLPPETTFENTKSTAPAYITKFFGVTPDGKPMPSDGIKKKSDSTMKDKAYTHPMYTLNQNQQTALTAFVQDTITKFNAGTCGQ
jgi:hypothetical protein